MRYLIVTSLVCLLLTSCASTPPPPAEPEPEPEPVATTRALGPVAHDGPIQADPGFYDCGEIPELAVCEFGVVLTNPSGETVVVERFSQNVAATARIGLVDHRTGFDRDLPYEMGSEPLRLLFWYRRADIGDVVGGSLFLDYRFAGEAFRLEIPTGANN